MAGLAAAALAMFTGAVAVNLLRGRRIDCGCSGVVADTRITWLTVARNLALTALAVTVAVTWPTALSIDGVLSDTGPSGPGTASALALAFTGWLGLLAVSVVQEAAKVRRLAAALVRDGDRTP